MSERRIWSILGNAQRLDGGAMFGNAPKALWTRWIPPDAENRIPLACRAMLVEEAGGRRILFEAGIGAFFPPKLQARFGITSPRHVLLDNLGAHGLTDADIDVVVLSHLHFDHAGGLLSEWTEGGVPTLLFPRAEFVVSRAAWDRANAPHARDRASFIPALQPLLADSGRLEIVDGPSSKVLGPDYGLHYSEGHTPGLMLVEVPGQDGAVVFCGDLIPGRPWVHLPITMGYDRYPERLIDEKTALLNDLFSRGARLFFTHDPDVAMAQLERDERGRYCAGHAWETLEGLTL